MNRKPPRDEGTGDLPARQVAVRDAAHAVLLAVDEGRRLDEKLDAALGRALPRDRGLLAELVRGTLQWQARYDHLIRRFSRRRPPDDPALLIVLRLGLHQLCGLDGVPAHAALHETGEMCRRCVGDREVAFVNGLLQAVRRQALGEPAPVGRAAREAKLRPYFDDLGPGSPAWLAAWHSLPLWLVEKWVARHGAATVEAMGAWINDAVPVTLHVRAPAVTSAVADALAREGFPVAACVDLPRTLELEAATDRAALTRLLGAHPELIVQDRAVQEATAWLAGDAVAAAGTGDTLCDLCAAPGGKAALLAGWWPGALVACDATRERTALLRGTLKRIEAPQVGVVLADGRRPALRPGSLAAVLLDGPCSGTGVLRHHPEGRWRLRPSHIERSAVRLGELAAAAADLLAPGGWLLYATCSLEPEENADVIAALLAARPDLAPAPDSEGRWQRLWLPHESGGDGFFAARLRRQ
jgi:16S rRNA (cytosine967-C5)-methyltransferase